MGAAALGVREEQPGVAVAGTLARVLARQQILLVLDNCYEGGSGNALDLRSSAGNRHDGRRSPDAAGGIAMEQVPPPSQKVGRHRTGPSGRDIPQTIRPVRVHTDSAGTIALWKASGAA
jgi:hypothetical protein